MGVIVVVGVLLRIVDIVFVTNVLYTYIEMCYRLASFNSPLSAIWSQTAGHYWFVIAQLLNSILRTLKSSLTTSNTILRLQVVQQGWSESENRKKKLNAGWLMVIREFYDFLIKTKINHVAHQTTSKLRSKPLKLMQQTKHYAVTL